MDCIGRAVGGQAVRVAMRGDRHSTKGRGSLTFLVFDKIGDADAEGDVVGCFETSPLSSRSSLFSLWNVSKGKLLVVAGSLELLSSSSKFRKYHNTKSCCAAYIFAHKPSRLSSEGNKLEGKNKMKTWIRINTHMLLKNKAFFMRKWYSSVHGVNMLRV